MSDPFNANEPGITENEKARRLFLARLTDWSEPGAVTVIRDGKVLGAVEGQAATPDTRQVAGVDADGNVRLNDGTILVP